MPGASDKLSPILWPPDSGTLRLLSFASDAILAFDPAKRCIWANRSACNEFSPQALVGCDLTSIFKRFSLEDLVAVERVLQQGREAQAIVAGRPLHYQPTCGDGFVLQL